MSASARLIIGWVVAPDVFLDWCRSKQVDIDIDEYLSDPDAYLEVIPGLVDIVPIYPFPDTQSQERRWGIHLNYCNESLSSIQSLPPYLIAQANEFMHQIDKKAGEPKCTAVITFT